MINLPLALLSFSFLIYCSRSKQEEWPSPILGWLHLQFSWWFLAVQLAPVAQGPGLQSGWHSFLVNEPDKNWQASLPAQSLCERQPTSAHETSGLPCNPGGHRQIAVWKSTSQTALLPHMVVRQGSTHSCDTHAFDKGQSLFTWHSSKKHKLSVLWPRLMLMKWWLYIGNIHHVGLQPIQQDSDKMVCEQKSGNLHFSHRDLECDKGLSTDFQCRLCYLDNLCHADIHLLVLKISLN